MFQQPKTLPTYRVSLLKSQVYRAMTAYLSKVLEPYNLSPPEWTLAGVLYEENSMPATELANYLGVKPPVVTASLNRLKTEKVIKKRPHPDDSRYIIVSLTAHGRRLVEEIEDKIQKDFKRFTRDIKKSDIRTYFKVLESIASKLKANQPNE